MWSGVSDWPTKKRAGKKGMHFFNTTHVPIQHMKYEPKLPMYLEIYACLKFPVYELL